MDKTALRKWLAKPRLALVGAVTEGVCTHVAMLQSRGVEFYGYALLPGEPYDIHSLVAASNGEADIKVTRTDSQYRYHRFSVDEWAHWDRDGFALANDLLVEANGRFASMHTKDAGDYRMDEFEVAHSNALLEAVVRGLEAAKAGGAFGNIERFLTVWISDLGHLIIAESVRRLNSKAVASEFMSAFG